MGLGNWIRGLFKPEQQEDDEFNIGAYDFSCPNCGSTRIIYGSVIGNFSKVVLHQEDPKYVETATCMDCGFKINSELDDTSGIYLKQLNYKLKG